MLSVKVTWVEAPRDPKKLGKGPSAEMSWRLSKLAASMATMSGARLEPQRKEQ